MAAPQGVNFDGTNDYLTRDADLTDNADSKLVTWSFWFRTDGAFARRIYGLPSGYFQIYMGSDGALQFEGFDNSFANGFLLSSGEGYDDGEWHHVLGSIDMENEAGSLLFLDDVSDGTFSLFSDGSIDFTQTQHVVGANSAGNNRWDGDLADFYLNLAEYVDLSVTANRRKFVGAGAANSVELGSDGSTPTGTAPIVYLSGETASWHTNDGTGGGFTENGALTDASSNPPDYPLPPSVTSSIDAILQQQGALLTSSMDAVLSQQRQEVAEISAVLQVVQALSADISAALKAEGQTQAASVDAALQAQLSKTTSMDAALASRLTLTASIDAVLQAAESAVAQMDAALQAQLSKTTSMDARLVNLRTAAASINAILLRQIQKTASINAALRGSLAVSASMDALLRTGFWQADDEGNGNWRKTPEGSGLWVKAPNTSTGWGNA